MVIQIGIRNKPENQWILKYRAILVRLMSMYKWILDIISLRLF